MMELSITKYCEEMGFCGTLLVNKHGNIVYHRAFGCASHDSCLKNTTTTQFYAGSITKQFTAMAILILHEQGKLDIDMPISRYLPRYPNGDKITISHLLSHTSGIKNYTDLFDHESKTFVGIQCVDSLLELFSGLALNFIPGTQYEYSNSGYVVLGAIIEKITSQPYWDYLKQCIFEPLGMHASGSDASILINKLAVGKTEKGVSPNHSNPYVRYAAGGLITTTHDLNLWNNAVINKVLLSQALTAKMFTAKLGGYGFGWRISEKLENCFFHGGALAGFSAFNVLRPAEGINITALSNVGNYQIAALTFGVYQRTIDRNG